MPRALALSLLAGASLALIGARPGLAAQELPFLSSYPGSDADCTPWTPVGPVDAEASEAARELFTAARQAVVLGDLDEARELFEEATERDGGVPELHYGHARVLEALGDLPAAAEAYCHVLAVDEGNSDAKHDALARHQALTAELLRDLPDEAVRSFERGTSSVDRRRYDEAARHFAEAELLAPRWAPAVYNHGVALARIGEGEEAARKLLLYLELEPDADDAAEVARRIGQLEASASGLGGSNPGTALTLGLMVPGLGQFYSGRSRTGAIVLAGAGAALATGLLVREVHVRCLQPPADGGSCPPEQVVSRRTEHPHLTSALLVAGAITVLGAVEAWLRADDPYSRGGTVGLTASRSSARAPLLALNDEGRLDLVLLQISMR